MIVKQLRTMADKKPLLEDTILDNYGNGLLSSNHPARIHRKHPVTKQLKTLTKQINQDNKQEIKVYKRRFYILFLYSISTMLQSCVWNTWGPISQSAKLMFGWSNGDIALLINWGPIAFILAVLPMSWIMDVKGLRWSCIISSGLTAIGAALRCITTQQPWASWLIHLGHLANGLAGPVAMAACTPLSATWFPPRERTTSTSIGNLFSALGISLAFIIAAGLEPVQEGVTRLLYLECGFSLVIFLAMVIYFPPKPDQPPSKTASLERVGYKQGLLAILRNRQLWLISLVSGITSGIIDCWISILDVDLQPIGISQNDAGWMGFYSILAGTIGGVIMARGIDLFAKHMKMVLVVLFTVNVGVFTWLAIITSGFVIVSKVHVWLTVVVGFAIVVSWVPITYELACEVTFPLSEGIATTALATCRNVFGGIFLLAVIVLNTGLSWSNWCVVGSIVVCIPLLLLIENNSNRFNLDMDIDSKGNSCP